MMLCASGRRQALAMFTISEMETNSMAAGPLAGRSPESSSLGPSQCFQRAPVLGRGLPRWSGALWQAPPDRELGWGCPSAELCGPLLVHLLCSRVVFKCQCVGDSPDPVCGCSGVSPVPPLTSRCCHTQPPLPVPSLWKAPLGPSVPSSVSLPSLCIPLLPPAPCRLSCFPSCGARSQACPLQGILLSCLTASVSCRASHCQSRPPRISSVPTHSSHSPGAGVSASAEQGGGWGASKE